MGKNLTVICVLGVVIFSLYLFISYKNSEPHQEIENYEFGEAKKVDISAENVMFYKYYGSTIASVASAQLMEISEPNVMDFYNSVRLAHYGESIDETLSSGTAQIILSTENLEDLFEATKNIDISKMDFKENVQVRLKNVFVESEIMNYDPANNVLSSENPSQLYGDTLTLNGSKGFSYNVKTRNIKMTGGINGVLK